MPNPQTVQNIILYNKSINTIKYYIAGDWKLNYKIGGFTGTERTDFDTTYFEFHFQWADTFIRIDTGKITLNTPINWEKPNYAPYGAYVMSWPLNPIQFELFAVQIKDGMLILSDTCPDCYDYYLSRVKL